jgi:hypothetical protein
MMTIRADEVRLPGGAREAIARHEQVAAAVIWVADSAPRVARWTFTSPENPSHVAIVMDVADLDALMAALQTPGGAAAMEHDGVLPETLVLLAEE